MHGPLFKTDWFSIQNICYPLYTCFQAHLLLRVKKTRRVLLILSSRAFAKVKVPASSAQPVATAAPPCPWRPRGSARPCAHRSCAPSDTHFHTKGAADGLKLCNNGGTYNMLKLWKNLLNFRLQQIVERHPEQIIVLRVVWSWLTLFLMLHWFPCIFFCLPWSWRHTLRWLSSQLFMNSMTKNLQYYLLIYVFYREIRGEKKNLNNFYKFWNKLIPFSIIQATAFSSCMNTPLPYK